MRRSGIQVRLQVDILAQRNQAGSLVFLSNNNSLSTMVRAEKQSL